MNEDWLASVSEIDVEEDLTLVVVRRRGKHLEGHRLEVHPDVAAELRSVCQSTVDALDERQAVTYDPDLQTLESDAYLVVPAELLTESASDTGVEASPELLRVLDTASELPFLSATDVPDKGFLLYAVVIGNDAADQRHYFIRKFNPRRSLGPGRLITAFGQRLRRVSEPILVLDDRFDILVTSGAIATFNPKMFSYLFRDLSLIQERYPAYVSAIQESLPVDDEGAQALVERCLTNSRLANKLRTIYERGHLQKGTVTIDRIREHAASVGIEESEVVRDGKLHIGEAEPLTLLKLLNEDLFTGGITGEAFEANSKSKRGQ